jgi:hypothetical protein
MTTTNHQLHSDRQRTQNTATRSTGAGANAWVLLVIGALLFQMAACGSEAGPQSENYGNILASPAGLILVESEHPTGWMRADCFGCHNVNNIHQVNRTGLPDNVVDLAGVRAIVNNQGEASCPMCHGDNGVPQ